MYLNLKNAFPKSAEDDRSVHFLSFPEPKQRYFNDDIQRQVNRMQSVIELGRVTRERKAISLKNPLPEIIVVHQDPQFLLDVVSLESYIQEELNVRQLVTTSDEKKYNIKLRVEPNFEVLGKKLGENLRTVNQALKELSPSNLENFLKQGSLVVAGHQIDINEVNLIRYFDSQGHLEANGDKELLVILNCDTSNDQSLLLEGVAREVVNRLQRLRKELQLNAVDDVISYYETSVDPDEQVKKSLVAVQDFIVRTLKRPILPKVPFDQQKLIAQREFEIKGSKMVVYLLRP